MVHIAAISRHQSPQQPYSVDEDREVLFVSGSQPRVPRHPPVVIGPLDERTSLLDLVTLSSCVYARPENVPWVAS